MKTPNKPTVHEILTRITELQKKAKDCQNDLDAIAIQKELVDILQNNLEDKEFIKQMAILSII